MQSHCSEKREFPPEAEKKGMMKEMNSMKDFDVYDEVLVKDCTEVQVNEALDCRWVKVWKNETDLRCRVVVGGCSRMKCERTSCPDCQKRFCSRLFRTHR